MPEIKVRLTGDNADFKKKLEESSAESRLMAAEMREHFVDLAERAGDIAGESGLGKIGGILKDLSSGAVLAFGTALVGAVAEGVKKASEFADAVARLGIAMGNMQLGKEMGEYIEKLAKIGAGPTKEQLTSAAFSMMSTGTMTEENVRRWIPRIQNLNAANPQISAEEWGEMIAGGSVGITRGLEHAPIVRGAMQASGLKDPLGALAWAADTTFGNSLNIMAAQPSGQMEGIKRAAGGAIDQLGTGILQMLFDPQYFEQMIKSPSAGWGGKGSQIAPGIFSNNPSMFGGPMAPAADLQDAAKSLKDSATINQEILQAIKEAFNASD